MKRNFLQKTRKGIPQKLIYVKYSLIHEVLFFFSLLSSLYWNVVLLQIETVQISSDLRRSWAFFKLFTYLRRFTPSPVSFISSQKLSLRPTGYIATDLQQPPTSPPSFISLLLTPSLWGNLQDIYAKYGNIHYTTRRVLFLSTRPLTFSPLYPFFLASFTFPPWNCGGVVAPTEAILIHYSRRMGADDEKWRERRKRCRW